MTENSSRETRNDTTAQGDGQFLCVRKVKLLFFCHITECQLVAEFVHSELSDSIGYLSIMKIAFVSNGLQESMGDYALA